MRDAPLTRAEQAAAAAGTLATAGIALIGLLAAWLGEPLLVRAAGARPMAPITALALLALSSAFGLLQARPARLATRTFVACVALGLATAVALLGTRTWVLPTQSRDWQTWLTSGAAQAEGLQPVHMAPVAAAMLVLTALGLLALALDGRGGHGFRRAGLAASVTVAIACGATAVSQSIGLSLFLAGGERPLSPWTAVALCCLCVALALNLGLKGACYRLLYGRAWLATGSLPSGERRARRLLTGGLLALVTSSLLLGIGYLRLHSRQVRAEVGRELTAVARLRAGAIAAWRHERLADARTLMRVPLLLAGNGPDRPGDAAANRQRLAAYLDGFRAAYGYASLTLFDAALRPTFVSPAGSSALETQAPLPRGVRAASDAVIADPQRTADGSTGLELVAPLRAADGRSFGGAVRLRLDADASLFTLLSGWPGRSETAESLLFRREGETLVYLSPLRHRAIASAGRALPVDQPTLLAAAAQPGRAAGLIEGVDYRGVPGLAVALEVAESPWVLLAKVDRLEAYAPVRDESERVVAGIALLLALGVTGAGLLWRQRQHELITRQWNTERARVETLEKLDLVMRHANDGILLLDESLRVVEANDRAAALYGYPPDELLRLALWDLRAPQAHAAVAADLERSAEPGGHVFETLHVRRDGTTFPVEVSSRQVEIGARRYRLSLIRDISERKSQERRLEGLNRMYQALSRINEAIVRTSDGAQLKRLVCRILVESGGFKLTWVGWLDETGGIVPQASFGGAPGHPEPSGGALGGRLAADGLVGRAIRDGRTCVSNDLLGEASTDEWRELAGQSGLCASIAIPLKERGRVSGALMAYAGQRDFFGPAEQGLLEETASDLSFALDVLARDAERRAAEAALETSESRYRLIAENTADVIWIYDLALDRFSYVSPSVERLRGSTAREMVGRRMQDVLTPASMAMVALDLPRRRELLERGDESARTQVDEVEQLHRDGHAVPTESVTTLLTDPGGRVSGILGVSRDISERKRADDALHERVRQLRTLHAISQTIAQRELDLPTQLARIAQDLPAIMAFPEDAQARIELRDETLTGGQDGALVERLSETIVVGGRPAGSVSVGYVRPRAASPGRPIAAERREILQSVARMLGTGLEAREAFASVEDTVVRRTAELAERNRQVQGLLQAIPDMVLRLRAQGALLSCQPASGSTRLAWHCRPLEAGAGDCLSDQLRAPVVLVGRRALASAGTVTEEVDLDGPDGVLALELRAAPVGPEEFVAFVRDITERKHLESEIAASLERERQISEMKSRFISVTSHEFRTPMAAVIGSTELLQNHLERLAPSKRDELFARIKGSLRRMTEMLDDLLLVNRIDAGRVEPQWAAVDLRSFVRGIVEEIRLGDRDAHRFVVETTGEARAFATDANLLHHVLANLLTNAARYSPSGTAITTRLGYERERVVLSVEDQGIGIPEADRERVFEAFERGSNVGTIKGTGLGLNIVKRMTALLRGQVGVSEAPGGGSRFELAFPLELRGA